MPAVVRAPSKKAFAISASFASFALKDGALMNESMGTYTWRAPRPDEVEAVAELVAACDVVDEGAARTTTDEIESQWARPGLILERDAWVATAPGGQVAAYGAVWEREPGGRYWLDGYVHPAFRGWGLGAALLGRTEARAAERIAAAAAPFPGGPRLM